MLRQHGVKGEGKSLLPTQVVLDRVHVLDFVHF